MPDLVLYTTGFCAPCRAARQVIDYASQQLTFTLTEVNASDHPDRALADSITSTPTLIAYNEQGEETWRFVGVPRLAELRTVLAPNKPVSSTSVTGMDEPPGFSADSMD